MNFRVTNRILFILSLCGLGVAIYLDWHHRLSIGLPCGPSHGCEEVALHPTAKGFNIPFLRGIPTAEFGVLFYAVLMIMSFIRAANTSHEMAIRVSPFQAIMAGIGVVISGILTGLEAFVIHAWCRYCVVSAIIAVLIGITSVIDFKSVRRAFPSNEDKV